MEQLGKLFELQQLEREIFSLQEKMKSSKESARKHEVEDAVIHHEKQLAQAEKLVTRRSKELKRLEEQLIALELEVAQIESRLFGGEVTNPKELGSLQENLDATKSKQQQLEESVLEAMERMDSYNEKMELAHQRTHQLQALLRDVTNRWSEAQQVREEELTKLRDVCDDLRRTVDPTLLSQYDALRERLRYRVVAKVNGRTCTGCHVTLPTSMKTVVGGRCPNCDRLLWWE